MTLRLTMVQMDMAWEDKERNRASVETTLAELSGGTDLVVLPEMFSTGFSMRSAALAEPSDGPTMSLVREWSRRFDLAICGSFIAVDNGRYFNRGFFTTPDSNQFYDKRHLFRMSDEPNHYSAGGDQPIIRYRGFNIRLLICYDLRFPVWARNQNNGYDLLVYVANWPESRIHAWNTLLQARAIENLAYVCGVNRCGTDGLGLSYNGNSLVADPKGTVVRHLVEGIEETVTVELSREVVANHRERFPAWKDADSFTVL